MTATTDQALAKVRDHAAGHRLFRRLSGLLVAVSGGADSLATLVLLQRLAPEYGFTLTVAHFDHQLRAGSHDDLVFVRECAAGLGVPFVSGEGDVASAARDRGRGIEEAARTMRYQFLGFVAAEKRLDAVVTGHTADDQAETVLLRILRGTGVRGIRGIQSDTTVPGGAQRLLRPLLCLTREETAAVCAEAGLVPREDPSNGDPAFLRNRVRHELLPMLEGLAPGVRRSLLGLAESASESFGLLERQAMSLLATRRDVTGSIFAAGLFAGLLPEARMLVIEREAAFSKLEPEVNRAVLQQLGDVLASGSGKVVFGEAEVDVSCDLVRIGPALDQKLDESKLLSVPGVTLFQQWRVTVTLDPPSAAAGALVASLDPSRLDGALRVRGIEPGDRIIANGLERSLADYLGQRRIPTWEREAAVVVAGSQRVHAVFVPSGVVGADPPANPADAWHVQLQPLPMSAPRG